MGCRAGQFMVYIFTWAWLEGSHRLDGLGAPRSHTRGAGELCQWKEGGLIVSVCDMDVGCIFLSNQTKMEPAFWRTPFRLQQCKGTMQFISQARNNRWVCWMWWWTKFFFFPFLEHFCKMHTHTHTVCQSASRVTGEFYLLGGLLAHIQFCNFYFFSFLKVLRSESC